jgi:3-phenylpropionate/trans-cinnamate dioxygenase ferredoxin component
VSEAGRQRLGALERFPDESLTPLVVADQEILVVRHQGNLYVVPDRCTHERFPLSDGELEDGELVCCYHGARFDLETGRPTLPAVKPLARYPVDVEAGEVFVTLP